MKAYLDMEAYLDMKAKTGSIYRLSMTAADVRSFLIVIGRKE